MAGYGGRAFLKGKKTTFHVCYSGEDEKTRQNLFFRIGSSVVSTATEHLRLEINYPEVQKIAREVWMEYGRLATLGRGTKGTRLRAYLCAYSRLNLVSCILGAASSPRSKRPAW